MVFILLNNYTDKKAYKSQFAEQLAIEKKATNVDLMKESVSSQ
jgi:predicted double-glycine peptidase